MGLLKQTPDRLKYQSKSLLVKIHQLRSVWRRPKHLKILNLADVSLFSFSSLLNLVYLFDTHLHTHISSPNFKQTFTARLQNHTLQMYIFKLNNEPQPKLHRFTETSSVMR